MTTTHIHSYLRDKYPTIANEVADRLKSIECDNCLMNRVVQLAGNTTDQWQSHVIIIASVLLLCSPETMHAGARVRNGVAKIISDNIGISQPAVSQKIDRAKHYYNHVSWCKDAVDIIVKEVRDDGEW